jgi:pimeloyl-ACP methyl ester carboxylesterase
VTEPTTHTLDVPGAVLTYDVHEPETTVDHRPLLIVGSPMGASGFAQLVPHFSDRKVITYDPRGMERSELLDRGEVTVKIHGDDVHRVVEASGLGPVDVLGPAVVPWWRCPGSLPIPTRWSPW